MYYKTQISMGTAFEDGVRVGPQFAQGSYNGDAQTPRLPLSSDIGGLLAPFVTYRVTPRTPPVAFTAVNGLAAVANDAIPNSSLPLLGDGFVARNISVTEEALAVIPDTNITISKANIPTGLNSFLVLDCPRTVDFVCTTAVTGACSFLVFGLDVYGQPLVSQITIPAAGVAAATTTPTPSAFLVVFAIKYAGAANLVGAGFFQASMSRFGLPYYLEHSRSATGYLVGLVTSPTFVAGNPVPTTAPIPVINAGQQNNVPVPFKTSSVVTAVTPDVRGLMVLPPATPLAINNTATLVAQYYAIGFDALLNQKASAGEKAGGPAANPYFCLPINLNMQYGSTPYAGTSFSGLVAMESSAENPADLGVKIEEFNLAQDNASIQSEAKKKRS